MSAGPVRRCGGWACATCRQWWNGRTRDRKVLVVTRERSLAERAESRWQRTSVMGGAATRPDLRAAVPSAQDEIVVQFVDILESCRQRRWLRNDIDPVHTIAWHHSLLIGRVCIEQGAENVDPQGWDKLTIEAVERAFFGS